MHRRMPSSTSAMSLGLVMGMGMSGGVHQALPNYVSGGGMLKLTPHKVLTSSVSGSGMGMGVGGGGGIKKSKSVHRTPVNVVRRRKVTLSHVDRERLESELEGMMKDGRVEAMVRGLNLGKETSDDSN